MDKKFVEMKDEIDFLEASEFDRDFIDRSDYEIKIEEIVLKVKFSRCKRLIKELSKTKDSEGFSRPLHNEKNDTFVLCFLEIA